MQYFKSGDNANKTELEKLKQKKQNYLNSGYIDSGVEQLLDTKIEELERRIDPWDLNTSKSSTKVEYDPSLAGIPTEFANSNTLKNQNTFDDNQQELGGNPAQRIINAGVNQFNETDLSLPRDFGSTFTNTGIDTLNFVNQSLFVNPVKAGYTALQSIGAATEGVASSVAQTAREFGMPPNSANRLERDLLAVTSAPVTLPTVGSLGALNNSKKLSNNRTSYLAEEELNLYNPPNKPLRDFNEDYPYGAKIESQYPGNQGRLAQDIDGNPLTARFVAGRTTQGGIDRGISPEVYDEISTGIMGNKAEGVSAEYLGPNTEGATYFDPLTKKPIEIGILNTLDDDYYKQVYGHEIGHVIDQAAGEIPTAGIENNLRSVYHTMNTGRENSTNQFGPQHFGYGDEDIPRELMAESIRAYMADPNYIKTVAPEVAKRIRKHVNQNPDINKTIQFNSTGAGIGLGATGLSDHQSKSPETLNYNNYDYEMRQKYLYEY
ncbi:hypothetical protein [Pseudemcibacter aquimaris]|uniref:hypothetical protein n=1 Tax=Pseudemcibacter aquimaris TaxID=2857064 RepID=UPI002011CFCA|nr:hypothetical protein [Pseudemcibacter aquimaris]MCC3859870.1 hypothetical protein [Pseudemcibacter aquimaris]WDU57202.1 hypothetical protein KW060_08325 [Pseudemcibacter aquimaris]